MTNNNICENCKYFVKHYYKDEFGRYVRIGCDGHCKHLSLRYNSYKRIIKAGTCEHFQPEEVNPQEDKRTVLEKLKHIKLLLSDVTHILKEK